MADKLKGLSLTLAAFLAEMGISFFLWNYILGNIFKSLPKLNVFQIFGITLIVSWIKFRVENVTKNLDDKAQKEKDAEALRKAIYRLGYYACFFVFSLIAYFLITKIG